MAYITKKKLEELKERLVYLEGDKRKEIAQKMATAKDKGDISENAELDAANEERDFNEREISELKQTIKEARIMKEGVKHDKVETGATVELEFDGDKATYQIVGTNDADLTEGKLSNESPLGKQLFGHAQGEEFEVKLPGGNFKVKIIKIT